jgi:hypothetical protein
MAPRGRRGRRGCPAAVYVRSGERALALQRAGQGTHGSLSRRARRRHPPGAHRCSAATDEFGHGAVGGVVPTRVARSLLAVERTPRASRSARVRTLLQPAPRPSSPGTSGPAASRSGSDNGSRAVHRAEHTPEGPTRRGPPRVLTCSLNFRTPVRWSGGRSLSGQIGQERGGAGLFLCPGGRWRDRGRAWRGRWAGARPSRSSRSSMPGGRPRGR